MAGIIDYIQQANNKFQFLKWVQIVSQESLATKNSALYFVEKNNEEVDAIIVDDLGQKRKLSGGNGESFTKQDDTLIVKFDKNYQKFYYNDPFIPESLIDPVTELPYLTKLQIDLSGASLGNSNQIYVTGILPFSDNENVRYQNVEIYKENLINIIILDYKSDDDITAIIINKSLLDNKFFYIPSIDFNNIVLFDKNYEIGSYNNRVGLFTLDKTTAIGGNSTKIFYNSPSLPIGINWVNSSNTLVFQSSVNCMIELYCTGTGDIIGNIFKI